MITTQELVDQVISLPVEERALLVDMLLLSLNPHDANNDKKWIAEAKRRLDDLRSGKVSAVDGEGVFNRLWEKYSSEFN